MPENMVNGLMERAASHGATVQALMNINTMANRCGWFFNACLDDEAESFPNNGYNCRHPECDEVEDGIGCCHTWSCPLCYEADEQDCERVGVEYESREFVICEMPDSEFNENKMWKVCDE